MSVREAVLAVAEGEINGRILASPDIPHKKLANARKGFITRADEVFLLVDDTVFGSGKDGLAITEKYIYAKQLFEIPKSIKISSIRSLEYESKRVNLDIYINNNLFLTLSSLERQDHDYLMAILQAAKEAATEGSLEPNQNEESPDIVEKDEVPTLSCDECNVELPPNAKFCLECGAKVLPKGVCLACDVKLPENAKFCPECGTPAGQQVEAKTSPTAGAGPQIDADQARNEISELLADAEQDVSIDSDGDLRIYFTTRGVPSFTSKLRGSAMSYSIKVMSEGEVAEDDSLSVNYSPDDDSISFGGPYLRVGKLPSAQYEIQIDASFWATTAVEIHEIKLKAGKIDAPSLGSSGISLSGLKATKDEGDGSYGVEYELKAYPNHYVHFDILSEKPEDDAILWPMLESDSTRSGTAWLYDIKPGDTFYLVFAEYEKIVDGITATLSGTAEPMEGAYDEANDAGRDGSSDALMEVCLRDVEGDEHIYWVEMGDLPDGEDEVDWAIEKARTYHTEHVGTEPAEDDEDDLPVTAYEPFDRSAEEYTLISSSRQYGGNAEESVVKLEFQIKRGIIQPDSEEISSLVNTLIELCDSGDAEEACRRLMPHMSFEFDPRNIDGDPEEFFSSMEGIYFDCDETNTSLRVGTYDGRLLITAAVQFQVPVKSGFSKAELQEYVDENAGYAAGYIGGDWSYTETDGDNLWVVDIKGAWLTSGENNQESGQAIRCCVIKAGKIKNAPGFEGVVGPDDIDGCEVVVFFDREDEDSPCGYAICKTGDKTYLVDVSDYGQSPDSQALRNALPEHLGGQWNNILLGSLDIEEMEDEGVGGILIYPDHDLNYEGRHFDVSPHVTEDIGDLENLVVWHVFGSFSPKSAFPLEEMMNGQLPDPLTLDFSDFGMITDYATDTEMMVIFKNTIQVSPDAAQGADLTAAANPLSEVREDIQAIEDKLYERGMLVSATGDHDAQVSISFEEWGEDGDRGLYWVISITSENSNDGDEDEGERISDYVSEKIDEISENWPSSSKALIEDSSGAVVLLNGSILY